MATRKRKPKGDEAVITAPTVRVYADWSPSRITSAERMSESGNLSLAASICDWLLTDDRVCATLDARVESLTGLVPTFAPSGDKRRSRKAVKALEAGEDFWKAYPESEITLMHKWGLLLGVAPLRHGWRYFPEHGNRLLPMPKFWHPQTLRRDQAARQWLIQDDTHAERVVTPGDGEWILHTPFGDSRPWAYGLWRSLARWVLLKSYARQDSGVAGEKAATAVVTSPEGSTREQRQSLANALLASGSDRLVVLGAGYDMKLLELSAQTGEIYRGQIDMANAAIAIRVRGGNLSTEVTGGSHAAAKSQAQTNDLPKLRFDAETVSSTLNEQSLSWWAEFNFGDRALAPWPEYPVAPEEDKKDRLAVVEGAARACKALEDLRFEIDDAAFIEEFGLGSFVKGRAAKPEPEPPEGEGEPDPPSDPDDDEGDDDAPPPDDDGNE